MAVPRVSIVYQISLSLPRRPTQALALARCETASADVVSKYSCWKPVPRLRAVARYDTAHAGAFASLSRWHMEVWSGLVWSWSYRMPRYFYHAHVLTLKGWVRDPMARSSPPMLGVCHLTVWRFPLPSIISVFDILTAESKQVTVYLEQELFFMLSIRIHVIFSNI